MDIYEVRRENLRAAVKIAGSMTKLAETVDTSTSYISQCLSTTVNKDMGTSMARRVEAALGFEKGWMDTPRGLQLENEDSPVESLTLLMSQLSEDEKEDLTEYVYMMIRKRKLVDKYK